MREVCCAIFSEVQATTIPAILPVHQTTIITPAVVAVAVVPIQVLRAVAGEVHPSVSFKELQKPFRQMAERIKLLLFLIYDS